MIRRIILLLLFWPLAIQSAGATTPDYAQYSYDKGGRVIDLGTQPLAVPIALFSELLKRDRILRDALAKTGWSLRVHDYAKGGDMMAFFSGGRLDASLLGDIPAMDAVLQHDQVIVALTKQTFTTVVGRKNQSLRDLRGKRIGNAPGSTGYFTLLEALGSVGLEESEVILVPMGVDDMPLALDEGKIDAFSAWEPAPTIALAKRRDNLALYRGLSSSYLLVNRTLLEKHGKETRHLLAAYARAFNWMRRRENLLLAANWVIASMASFSAKAPKLGAQEIADIARREIMGIPSAPLLPHDESRLKRQFGFLQNHGKLPAGARWDRVRAGFLHSPMGDVLSQASNYRLDEFDYEERPSP